PVLGSRLGPLDALDAHEALLVIATVAIWMFGMGTFAAQVLVALSAPGPAVRAAWLSVAVLVTVSGIASLVSGPSGSAAWSLVAASAAFAFVAVRAADRAFRHADLTFYRTM
ncbi:MAG: hypothetical protein ACRDWW_04825, partial [Acidimicrobiales bacterium]